MSTIDTDPEVDRDTLATAEGHTDVTEIWPGRFALEVETGTKSLSTTTTLDLDTEQLCRLSDQIDAALENAH